jgi:hypothetical protein
MFALGSAREPEPLADRQLGLQEVRRKNAACEHVIIVGERGPASLAIKMRGADLCPHCTRREAAYWRMRAKTAEGVVIEAQKHAHVESDGALAAVRETLDRMRPMPPAGAA